MVNSLEIHNVQQGHLMNNHTTAQIGKRIHVILYDGRQFTDKLKEIKSKYYVFEASGRIMRNQIRSFAINRGSVTHAT